VAVVLAEPVMTNIGIIHPDPGFHAALREITRRTSLKTVHPAETMGVAGSITTKRPRAGNQDKQHQNAQVCSHSSLHQYTKTIMSPVIKVPVLSNL
jgi:hypothetical protein